MSIYTLKKESSFGPQSHSLSSYYNLFTNKFSNSASIQVLSLGGGSKAGTRGLSVIGHTLVWPCWGW